MGFYGGPFGLCGEFGCLYKVVSVEKDQNGTFKTLEKCSLCNSKRCYAVSAETAKYYLAKLNKAK